MSKIKVLSFPVITSQKLEDTLATHDGWCVEAITCGKVHGGSPSGIGPTSNQIENVVIVLKNKRSFKDYGGAS